MPQDISRIASTSAQTVSHSGTLTGYVLLSLSHK